MRTLAFEVGKRGMRVGEALWLVVVLAVAWWFLSEGSESLYFPPLSTIWQSLATGFTEGSLWTDLVFSLTNIVAGLALGSVIAVLLGLVIGQVENLRLVLDPLLQFARSVPQSALIPIVIGALGIGQAPKIYMIAFACLWPVLLNTIDGVRSIPPEVLSMAKAYRIPRLLRLRKVILPAATPQIVAGIRVSLAVGVVVMVVSEIYSSLQGLGHSIHMAGSVFDVSTAWAGTLVVGVLGYVLSTVFVVVERSVLGWYYESAALAGGKSRVNQTRRKARK
ncbi:ABC transporter permease [Citricoccus sp. K5]|uniref:ABC transporter permease n=1 Tax=Citricoccus sp. K5 TaxID=2653135 RepID=UPI0012F21A03|nr:ABC transporter permease [Citricoccus sp. K5]VXB90319.1 ABC transporter permease [Citricoccus sp. K5]